MAVPCSFDAVHESGLILALEQRWNLLPTSADAALLSEQVAALETAEMRLRKEGRWVAGPTSLLEILRLQFDEVRNCRVVRWLLDPLSPHGFGADALQRVLEVANDLASRQGLEVRAYEGTENAVVRVEETRSKTRADIVIDGPAWQIVIEAKVNASEQDEQGKRLNELWPGASYIYLTRRRDPMRTAGEEPWILMRWIDLLGAVRQVAGDPDNVGGRTEGVRRARRALHDYLYSARRLI